MLHKEEMDLHLNPLEWEEMVTRDEKVTLYSNKEGMDLHLNPLEWEEL